MASDIFIVRITPAKGKKSGTTFPWIVVQELERKRTSPRPKLQVSASGYSEKLITNNLAGPEKRAKLKGVATQLGMAILKASGNVMAHAKP